LGTHAHGPPSAEAWRGLLGSRRLGARGELLFFAAVKRIDRRPRVAATIEPVVALCSRSLLFSQTSRLWDVIGLVMVVGGVATGYLKEGAGESA